VLIAIVAPTLLAGGPAEALATATTVGVTARTGNFFLAIAVGVGAVWVLRQVF
jgi:uncharacterized membrane protein